MIIYHEIHRDSLRAVLRDGLRRTSRGEKGDDRWIKEADRYLDAQRPHHIKQAGVCRDSNLYGFVGDSKTIIDITDGRIRRLANYKRDPRRVFLKLAVDHDSCYVSNLDLYDSVKTALPEASERQEALAKEYWSALVPLKDFRIGTIRRPEVMITCDLTPAAISVVE